MVEKLWGVKVKEVGDRYFRWYTQARYESWEAKQLADGYKTNAVHFNADVQFKAVQEDGKSCDDVLRLSYREIQ